MANSNYRRSKKTTGRYMDVADEPVTHMLSPIKAYQTAPLVSLAEAIEPISGFFNEIHENAWVAMHNCEQPKEGLTQNESAAIHLYTMQFDGGPSLFKVLNENLRAVNRRNLEPWHLFLKLFLTALYKLPSQARTVWRGLRDVDLSSDYPKGKKVAWWGVSSCTKNIEVLKNEQFLGDSGVRTMFSIECQYGKSVTLHSYYKGTEEEIILMPGSYFEVIGQLNAGAGLHIIQLKEIDPLFPLVKPPLDKPTSPTSNIDATLLKIKLSPPSPIDTKPTKSRMLYNSTTNRANSLPSRPSIPKFEDKAVSETADEYPASSELNVPFKSPKNKFKVKSCDMSLYVQEQIIPIIISSVDKGGRNDDIAARIQIAAHKNFESTWHCVVGDHFGSAVSHSIGGFLDTAYDEKTVLLWKD